VATVLVVGDGASARAAAALLEQAGGRTVLRALTHDEALRHAAGWRPEVALVPAAGRAEERGAATAAALRELDVVVIGIGASAGERRPAEAVADDRPDDHVEWWLPEPYEPPALLSLAERGVQRARGWRAARAATLRQRGPLRALAGGSASMRELRDQVELLAGTDTTALLVGEAGTGKGRIAEYIHARGARRDCAFLAVRCAGCDERALALALFGRAAADDEHPPGALRLADGGTLFLDEIGAVAEPLQRRLLDALRERRVPGAGGRALPVDVRLVASTSRDLVTEVTEGRFLEELYYLLSARPLHVPPLRARERDDVVALVEGLAEELATEIAEAPRAVGPGALERLLAHPWPGNARELRSVLERALLAARGAVAVQEEHLPGELRGVPPRAAAAEPRGAGSTLDDVERAHIDRTLRAHGGNRTHAARALGISRATLIKKIRDYAL